MFASGARFQSLYVVRSGSFKTTLETNGGEQQVLGFHLPGEIIGFDALSDDVHRCNAEAMERSSVCEVPFAQLDEFASSVPGLRRQLMRIASREVVKDHEHLMMMGRKQAQERLAVKDAAKAQQLAEEAFKLDGKPLYVYHQAAAQRLRPWQPGWRAVATTAALIAPCRAAGLGYALLSATRPATSG